MHCEAKEEHHIDVGNSYVDALVTVAQSPVAVIALHPWGPMGGSMGDPHPHTVVRLFGRAGCSTARFNFRSGLGFGNSSVEDVKAVARRALCSRQVPSKPWEVLPEVSS